MAENILEVKGLKKYFKTNRGTLHAVDDITFTIERGKTLGIVGYLIAIYATEILNAALSIVRLLQRTEVRLPVMALVAKPLVCIVGATSVTRLLYALFPVALTPGAQTTQLVILFAISLLMYWGFLRLFKGIGRMNTGREWNSSLKKQKQPHII